MALALMMLSMVAVAVMDGDDECDVYACGENNDSKNVDDDDDHE